MYTTKTSQNKSLHKKRYIKIVLACILAIILIVAGLELTNTTNIFGASKTRPIDNTPVEGAPDPVDANTDSTPTAQTDPGEAAKERIASEETPAGNSGASNNSQKKTVQPTVTSTSPENSEIIARGMVNGVVEEGGTCSFVFSTASASFTVTTKGIANASNTICSPARAARSKFVGSGWTVLINYSSASAQGSSSAVEVQGL